MIATGLVGKLGLGRGGDSAAVMATNEAFGRFWEETRPQIWRLTARISGSPDAADDLTQEVGIRALQALPRFRGDADRRTYLYRIAINAALRHNERRRRAGIVEALDSADDGGLTHSKIGDGSGHAASAEAQLLSAERLPRIRAALDVLPDDFRTPLVLLVYEDMKYREIADLLEIPIGTVMSRIHAARQRLRTALPEEFDNE